MNARHTSPFVALTMLCIIACGGSGPSSPSSDSFLAGTWRGTITIQQTPTMGTAPPATSAPVTWMFEVVPNTNLQTFRATIRSEHDWLPITMLGTTAIVPGNMPPAQISTQGDYSSPRGCRGTFGSFGTAQARQIDADFTGVDCTVTFTGRVTLTKS
jgi:hypothetical protein